MKKAKGKAKSTAKSKAKALKKAPSEQPQKAKWAKLRKTTGTNPERCYITGSTEIGGKLKLIVEISHKRIPRYKAIADTLMARIEEQQLSKEVERRIVSSKGVKNTPPLKKGSHNHPQAFEKLFYYNHF